MKKTLQQLNDILIDDLEAEPLDPQTIDGIREFIKAMNDDFAALPLGEYDPIVAAEILLESLFYSTYTSIAKVKRDSEMVLLDKQYQGYGFALHIGYGTVKHRAALKELGPCAIHRKNFAPVSELLVGVPV